MINRTVRIHGERKMNRLVVEGNSHLDARIEHQMLGSLTSLATAGWLLLSHMYPRQRQVVP